MSEYFYKNRIPAGTENVWPMEWFKYVNDKNNHREFKEHCIAHKKTCF